MMERQAILSSTSRISDRCGVSSHRAIDYAIADVCDQVLTYPTMSFVKASFDRQPEDKADNTNCILKLFLHVIINQIFCFNIN